MASLEIQKSEFTNPWLHWEVIVGQSEINWFLDFIRTGYLVLT